MPMLKFTWDQEKNINYLAVTKDGNFWLEKKNLCGNPDETEIEGISKIKFIKTLTGPVLEFEFVIRSKENFNDGVT